MKKNLLILLLLLSFCFVMPVMAANISSCESSMGGAIIDEKIPNTVSTIIKIIRILVPILLVIFGMLDLVKGIIAQKEEEIKKGQQIFIKRLIAGALVFFVFALVQFIVGLVADDDKENIMSCANCFINGDCTEAHSSETESGEDNPNEIEPEGDNPNEIEPEGDNPNTFTPDVRLRRIKATEEDNASAIEMNRS